MGLFNMDKLPSYTKKFANAKIVDIGAGAVGSHVVEKLLDMKISDIEIIDFDKLEDENLSKSSKLYRKEDIGKNKANALAHRANELIGKNTVHGIDASITMFGPMAFAGYDAIIAPLDNYGAKIYTGQIWKQIPDDARPLLIFGGTIDENAQSNSLDGRGPCLRCLLSEEWLENPLARTSCTGPQYRGDEESVEIVSTTGNASDLAACFMIEHLRGRLLGIEVITCISANSVHEFQNDLISLGRNARSLLAAELQEYGINLTSVAITAVNIPDGELKRLNELEEKYAKGTVETDIEVDNVRRVYGSLENSVLCDKKDAKEVCLQLINHDIALFTRSF